MNQLTRSLEEVTNEAKIIYNRMEKDYARWGELMMEAKKLVPHGQWLSYLEENFPMVGERQARRYMELAKDETKTLTQITNAARQESNRSSKTDLSTAATKEKPREDGLVNTPSDYQLDKLNQRYLTDFKQRSMVMIMHIREFLTLEEPVGRDLAEVVKHIDKVDSFEDLRAIREMQYQCERLCKRAMTLAEEINSALEGKEKVV